MTSELDTGPTNIRPRRILVTGGAGFIGSHLARRLLDLGHDVVVVDNLCSGTKRNIEGLIGRFPFNYIQHDVTVPLSLEVDEIYHLACPGSPMFYQRHPIETTKTCVLGALNMLSLAENTNARILLASTSEVYGDPLQHPQTERYWGNVNPIGIRSCYDEGKRCAESLFFDYQRRHQLQIKVARIFNTYGPRMLPDDGRVVSNFVVQALKNETLTIYGGGQQTRAFCYIDDLVEGLVLLMQSDAAITGPINIGSPHEFTILELAEKILHRTGSKSGLVHTPLPADDPSRRRPDVTQAETLLGWAPTTGLDLGLDRTIAHFKKLLT